MNKLPKDVALRALRAQLHHFDHSPDFGDAEAVRVIRQHLLQRIREVEGAMRIGSWLQQERAFEEKAA